MKNTDADFSALLPDSLRHDPVIQALEAGFSAEYRRLVTDIPAVMPWEDLDAQTEPVLSLMAYDVNPLFWDPGWTDDVKRDVLRNALRWRMIHGTPACVEEFLAVVLRLRAEVIPWWLYGGEPGRFRVHVDFAGHGYDEEAWAEAVRIILRANNTRSHLDALEMELRVEGVMYLGAAVLVEERITLWPYVPPEISLSMTPYLLAGTDMLEAIALPVADRQRAEGG